MKLRAAANKSGIKVHTLAQTPGKADLLMYEIGTEVNSPSRIKPAIFVVANMEGNLPLTTEAALWLADDLAGKEKNYKNYTWYIVPVGNPDAYSRFFQKPLYRDTRNGLVVNDDLDDRSDEDGYNDLDGNGIITMMRVKSPDGEWIPVASDPRLMRKADPLKGEKGIYKLYTEGIDDDGDGKYNEDGQGGTNPGLNFPHLFKMHDPEKGLYPGSAPESFAVMEFVFSHPEIAMTFSFGSSNFCQTPPRGGRRGSADLENISLPEDMAKMLGFDPQKTYTMKEIIDKVKPMVPPGMEVDEAMISSFLGLGAIVNPLNEDLAFYKKLSEEYTEYLKKKGITAERFDAEDGKDGSFELWSYYHLGLPVFSMDLWSVPKPKEEKAASSGLTVEALEKMSKDEFLALGEEKVAAFLKESGAPAQFKASMVIEGVKSGQASPAQMAGMLKQMPKPVKDDNTGDPKEKATLMFYEKMGAEKAFVDWKKFTHPTLGEVEIGGFRPFADNTPPVQMADSIIKNQVPWIYELAAKLPSLKISDAKVVAKGSGIYQMEVWVRNENFLPFPTAMGKKNKQPAPAILMIDGTGIRILSGKARTLISAVEGNKAVKITWLIQSEKPVTVSLSLSTKTAGSDVKQIKLEE